MAILVLISRNRAAVLLPTTDGVGIWRVGHKSITTEYVEKRNEEMRLPVRVEYVTHQEMLERIVA